MKYLKLYNEINQRLCENFENDQEFQDILNIARDEGIPVTTGKEGENQYIYMDRYPISEEGQPANPESESIMDVGEFIDIVFNIYQRLERSYTIIHKKDDSIGGFDNVFRLRGLDKKSAIKISGDIDPSSDIIWAEMFLKL